LRGQPTHGFSSGLNSMKRIEPAGVKLFTVYYVVLYDYWDYVRYGIPLNEWLLR
jgi:hypothetical protein